MLVRSVAKVTCQVVCDKLYAWQLKSQVHRKSLHKAAVWQVGQGLQGQKTAAACRKATGVRGALRSHWGNAGPNAAVAKLPPVVTN